MGIKQVTDISKKIEKAPTQIRHIFNHFAISKD
jgi:hypothetical protein